MEHRFATIERAIKAAEANGRSGGDQILLREGTYYPPRPLMLSERPDRRLTDFHSVKGIEFSHNLRFGGDGNSGPGRDGSGPGDVRTDPRLVDPRGGRACDFALRPDSPAIDAGTPAGVHLDYFGNPRPLGPRYDIGAHEWSKNTEGWVY